MVMRFLRKAMGTGFAVVLLGGVALHGYAGEGTGQVRDERPQHNEARPAAQQQPGRQNAPRMNPAPERPAQQQQFSSPRSWQPTSGAHYGGTYSMPVNDGNQQPAQPGAGRGFQSAPSGSGQDRFGAQGNNAPAQQQRNAVNVRDLPVQRDGAWQGRNPVQHSNAIPVLPARGSMERAMAGGGVFRVRGDGNVSDVHDARSGLDLHIGLMGNRSFVSLRPDHSSVFFEKGRPGWVQHPYSFHGRDFARRTFVDHGMVYSRFYRGYMYQGALLEVYAPTWFYPQSYYGWIFRPWLRPIAYSWDWRDDSWYSGESYYFTPSSTYPSATYWLADYLIATDLALGYQAQVEAGLPILIAPPDAALITPEVKAQIAGEVQTQLNLEQQMAQQPDADPSLGSIGAVFNDVAYGHTHVFVVSGMVDAVDSRGRECSLSDGDVLLLQSVPAPSFDSANLVVLAEKGGLECARGAVISLSFASLQEMLNQMRATIDQGLQELLNRQGPGGLPDLPAVVAAQPAPYVTAAPAEDPTARKTLQNEAQQCAQQESQERASAGVQSTGEAQSVTKGQSIRQVVEMMGEPRSSATAGNKTIYNYEGLKVIFLNGYVAEVE